MTNELKKKKKMLVVYYYTAKGEEERKEEKTKRFSGDAAQSLVHTMMMSPPTAHLTMARPD